MTSMGRHIPAQQGDEDDWNKSPNDPANSLGTLGVEFASETRSELTANKPPDRATHNEAENRENRRANKETNVISRDGRTNPDGKQATNRAYHSACKCAHVTFTKTRFTH